MNVVDSIQIVVRSSAGVLFDGVAISLSSKNKMGKFDVLPRHANFISIFEEELVVAKSNAEKVSFKTKLGVLRFFENKAEVFVDVE